MASSKRKSAAAGDNAEAKKPKHEEFKKLLKGETDQNGNKFWEISHNRRLTITAYKSQVLVNIREWYDNNTKPGNKGIALTIDQYKEMVHNIKAINAELKEQGQIIDDIEDSEATASSSSKDESSTKEAEEPVAKKKLTAKKSKKMESSVSEENKGKNKIESTNVGDDDSQDED